MVVSKKNKNKKKIPKKLNFTQNNFSEYHQSLQYGRTGCIIFRAFFSKNPLLKFTTRYKYTISCETFYDMSQMDANHYAKLHIHINRMPNGINNLANLSKTIIILQTLMTRNRQQQQSNLVTVLGNRHTSQKCWSAQYCDMRINCI